MSNKKTPKAKARRISQLKRLGYEQDIIDDIISLGEASSPSGAISSIV